MDDETQQSVEQIMDIFTHKFDLASIAKVPGEIVQIYDNLNSCAAYSFLNDLRQFCNNDNSNCSWNQILINVSNNMFLIMGKVNDIASVAKKFPLQGVSGDEQIMA